MKKAIIFDLDGTLLNTISDLNNSINLTYKAFNIDRVDSTKKTMSMVGHGIKNLIDQCFIDYPKLSDSAYKKFLEIYNDEYYKTTTPYQGIKEMIDILVNNGIKIGVNSNKNDSYSKKLIEIHFPNINQDLVLGHIDNMKVKPDPEGANLLISKMNVDKKDVVYIGDSSTDIKTAENAGIDSLSVTWGFRSEEELKHVAHKLVYNPQEIIDYVIKCL